ncbi:MAG: hypothetical protein R3C44_05725 [Chloroflexota bacterium]
MDTQRNKVTVNVPLWLVTFGLGTARRFGADLGGLDPEMVKELIKQGSRGVLVDVQSGKTASTSKSILTRLQNE